MWLPATVSFAGTSSPSSKRKMSTAMRGVSVLPEYLPWIMTRSPSAMIAPGSYRVASGRSAMKLRSPALAGGMVGLCWM